MANAELLLPLLLLLLLLAEFDCIRLFVDGSDVDEVDVLRVLDKFWLLALILALLVKLQELAYVFILGGESATPFTVLKLILSI